MEKGGGHGDDSEIVGGDEFNYRSLFFEMVIFYLACRYMVILLIKDSGG